MSKSIFILLSFAFFSSAYAEKGSSLKETPLASLDALIQSTDELAAKQKELKVILTEYFILHDAYLLDRENRTLLLKTAKLAKKSLNLIKEEKLTPLFDSDLLSEMTLFAKLAGQPSIPSPP